MDLDLTPLTPAPIAHLDTKSPPLIDGRLMLSDSDLDQLSAILSDFIAQSQSNIAHFRNIPSNPGASELTQKWIERAADLRDRIERRE